ncbi:MAG: tetratricopeptide repeat protein [Candidatus Methanoperedens sp.]|nr:tetratricopeptide repeat protein [Candidatus Methanoperedens sp.]
MKNISDCFIRNLPEMTGAVINDASFELSNDKLKLLNVTREKVDQYSKVKGKPVKDANILRTLGNEVYYLGKPEDAFKYFTEALEIDEELKDIRGKPIDLNNIGLLYQDWGKPEKALEFYEKALKID